MMSFVRFIVFFSMSAISRRTWICVGVFSSFAIIELFFSIVICRRIQAELGQDMRDQAEGVAQAIRSAYYLNKDSRDLQRMVAVFGVERGLRDVSIMLCSTRQVIASTKGEWVNKPISSLSAQLSVFDVENDLYAGHASWKVDGHRGGLVTLLKPTVSGVSSVDSILGDARIVIVVDGREVRDRLGHQASQDFMRLSIVFSIFSFGLTFFLLRFFEYKKNSHNETIDSPAMAEGDRCFLAASVASAVAVKKAIDESGTGMAVMELVPEGGKIIHANPGFIVQGGYCEARHATGGWIMPIPAEAMTSLCAGTGAVIPLRHRKSDGTWFEGDLRLDPVRSTEGGPVTQAIGMILDCCGERAVLSKKSDENIRLRTMIERLPVAVLVHDGHASVYANPVARKLFLTDKLGVDAPWTMEDRIQPQDWERASFMWRMALQDGAIQRGQFLLRRDDGSEFQADMIAESIAWENGNRAVLLTVLDHENILEGVQAGKDPLKEFRRLFDEIPNPTWRSTAQGSGAFFNKAWRSLTGRSEAESNGDAWRSAIHPEDLEAYLAARDQAHQVRTPFNGVYRLSRFDHSWAWIAEHGTPCYEDGEFSGYLFSCYDITDLKMAEQVIRGSHAESELLLSTIGSAIIGIDTNDRVMRCNAAAERMFGLSASEIVGRTLAETGIRLDWADIFIAINECTMQGSVVELHDLRYQRSDGSDGFLDIAINASRGAWGDGSERLGVVLLATDVTERKVTESQRNQGMKLEAIGQLAAGIAHEINTPIQFVGDNLRFLRDAYRDFEKMRVVMADAIEAAGSSIPAEAMSAVEAAVTIADPEFMKDEIPKAIEQSLDGVDRVATIVKAMKEFSHPGKVGKNPTDINHLISTTLTVSRNEYKYVADIDLSLEEGLPMVPCVASEVSQVVLNLIVNASHAIADVIKGTDARGRISVSTRRDGNFIVFSIGDTGGGIPEHIRSRIFDPFFTTKEVGRGTGQGLYIARTVVVKKHGGTIDFTSESGVGSIFTVRLPLVEGGAS